MLLCTPNWVEIMRVLPDLWPVEAYWGYMTFLPGAESFDVLVLSSSGRLRDYLFAWINAFGRSDAGKNVRELSKCDGCRPTAGRVTRQYVCMQAFSAT